jgi:hypothetical protein
MKKLLMGACAAAVLAGCAAPEPTWTETVESGLAAHKGEHIRELFGIWGMPDGEGEIAGQRYYLWERSFASSVIEPRQPTATDQALEGRRIGQAKASDEEEYITTQVQADCRIRVFVDTWGRISNWDGRGNEFGCGRLADDMKRVVGDQVALPSSREISQ